MILVEVQCLPTPAGMQDEPYAYVDRAIAEIQDAGVRYEVGALGTTLQGAADVVWPLLRRVHEACLEAGAESVITNIKVAQASGDTPGIDDLTAVYRP